MLAMPEVEAGQDASLQSVPSMCAQDGSPLRLGRKLHRLLQLQVLFEYTFLCITMHPDDSVYVATSGRRGTGRRECAGGPSDLHSDRIRPILRSWVHNNAVLHLSLVTDD